jgi:imidazole glycerol-phosphate synthase subunit HisH
MGNLGSIQNMIRKIGHDAVISTSHEEIMLADKLILPGVGHFDRGMEQLDSAGLIQVLNSKVIAQKCPVIGICLGMQLLCNASEEGQAKGLGWVNIDFVKFKPELAQYPIKIPHMSWNYVQLIKPSRLTIDLPDPSRYYFVHAYHAIAHEERDVLMRTDYGYSFVSAFEKDNIIGVQFHPEKSHKFGFQLLKNFVERY